MLQLAKKSGGNSGSNKKPGPSDKLQRHLEKIDAKIDFFSSFQKGKDKH
ncbi:hypothetical protein CHCC20335_1040 [Bacillus paralicheniformis]|nr:hypothetical protein CHCC20335_1040 [Bacillus paralicheniformis]